MKKSLSQVKSSEGTSQKQRTFLKMTMNRLPACFLDLFIT